MSQKKSDLSFALGLAVKNLGLDPNQINDEQMSELDFLVNDALSEQPKTEEGKKLKFNIIKEKGNPDSEYVKNFSFGKDLRENKVKPATILLGKLVAENIQQYIEGDNTENRELIDKVTNDLMIHLNEVNYPLDYLDNIFKDIASFIGQLKSNVEGQREARKDEILALAIGVKHPTYKELTSRIVSFKDLNDAIEKLRKDYNFTAEDYRA